MGEKIAVRIGPLPVPQDAREVAGRGLDHIKQALVRAPRRRDQEADAKRAERFQRACKARVVLVAELVDRILAPEDHAHPRARQRRNRRRNRLAQLLDTGGRKAVRRRQRREDVVPAQAVVVGHPDHVGRPEPGLGVLHHHAEHLRSRPSAQRPHVGNAAAPQRDGDIRPGRRKTRAGLTEALGRIDRRPGGTEAPYPLGRDVLHLIVETQGGSDAFRLHIHPGLAGGDDPRPQPRQGAANRIESVRAERHQDLLSGGRERVESPCRRRRGGQFPPRTNEGATSQMLSLGATSGDRIPLEGRPRRGGTTESKHNARPPRPARLAHT